MNYSQEENMQFMTNEAHKVRGSTLFLAELYIQLQNVIMFCIRFLQIILTIFLSIGW